MNRLYRLLAFGHLPKELPPIFHSKTFAQLARSPSIALAAAGNQWRRPTTHLLAQRAHYLRQLSIINPANFYTLAAEIAKNYSTISALSQSSPISASTIRFNNRTKFFRAVGAAQIGSAVRKRKLSLRARFPYILQFDIKNFYRSIYTHAIPWAFHSKKACKNNLKLPKSQRQHLFGDDIDKRVREGQDGQTIGIPVGPDTSFIISEALLSSIDGKLSLDAAQAVRFYDDYEIGCHSVEAAENILRRAERILGEFELELNHEKTRVSRVHSIGDTWQFELRKQTGETDSTKEEDLLDLHNLTTKIAAANPGGNVFKYFIRRMRKNVLPKTLWPLWQDVIYSAAHSERGVLREVFEQLDLYSRIGYPVDKLRLRHFLEGKAHSELNSSVNSELSWVLFGFKRFSIRPNTALLESAIRGGDDTSRLIAAQIAIERKIPCKRAVKGVMELWEPECFRTQHWLLMWEMYKNGWLKDARLSADVSGDSFFKLLDLKDVTFMRDSVLDLSDVPAPFRAKIPKAELDQLLASKNEAFKIADETLDIGDEGDSAVEFSAFDENAYT